MAIYSVVHSKAKKFLKTLWSKTVNFLVNLQHFSAFKNTVEKEYVVHWQTP